MPAVRKSKKRTAAKPPAAPQSPTPEQATPPAPKPEQAQPPQPEVSVISIDIPIGVLVGTEQRRHIDLDLRMAKATTLRRIADGLDRRRATLSSGQRVVNLNSAMKWILEQVERQLEKPLNSP